MVGLLDADGFSLWAIVGNTDTEGSEVGKALGYSEGCILGCDEDFAVGCKVIQSRIINLL